MIRRSRVNARSEFAKFRPDAGLAGDSGGGGGAFGGNSGGVGVPAGALGSKKPSGFGRLFTSSMFRAATAASRKPAFNPTLGSCALTLITTAEVRAPK